MAQHAFIAPSSAAIWGKPGGCTGYPTMAVAFHDTEEGEASKIGTAAHELGETLIQLATASSDTVSPSIRDAFIGKSMSNGIVVDDEMFDAAWIYADDVVRTWREFRGEVNTERPVKATSIHATESYGTVDCEMYVTSINTLFIWDYKHGMGVVEVFENWQGINYAAGLMDEYNLSDIDLTVIIRIVQPRAFHADGPVREWKVTGAELRGYVNTLHNNAHKALSNNAETLTGDHCRYCEALHACPAAIKAGLALYEVAGRPIPELMTTEAMALQYSIVQRAKKQLEYLETAYEEQLKSAIRNGESVSGYELTPSYERSAKWTVSDEEVLAIGDSVGIDLRKPLELITPTQAKDKGLDKDVVSMFSERKQKGLKLAPINSAKLRRVFK